MEFLAGLLPFAVFLVCPLMMVFMMRGMMHGGHGGHERGDASEPGPDAATERKLAAMELEIARLRGELHSDSAGQSDAVGARRDGDRHSLPR